MIEGFHISEPLIWVMVAVVFAIIEALTMGLTTIWFTIGGVAACIAALLGAPLWLQIVIFLAVSIVLLYYTRPLAEKKLKIGHEKTNIENLIGQTGIVTQEIKPYNTGLVKLNGQSWTAVENSNKNTIAEGKEVKVKRIEGVKLIVEQLEGDN